MTGLLESIRVNHATWSWGSVRFSIDSNPMSGVVSVDYEESLETRVIPSNSQDGPPLGIARGAYRVGRFPLRMLRDDARMLKRYLSAKALTQGMTSYGQATFDAVLCLAGDDAPDFVPSTTTFVSCRIVGEHLSQEDGIEGLVTEFSIACLAAEQDGASLWNAVTPLPGFPTADSITLANVPAPGKWTLIAGPKVFGWDERKGYGLSGATTVPTGDELVKPEFLVEIWDPADYLLFVQFRKQLLKKPLLGFPGAPGLALGIGHPELNELGVSAVVVKESHPLVNDGYGVWQAKILFWEYRKPLPALSKPSAAIPDAAPPVPTAETALEALIQQRQAQAQAAAGVP